MTTKIIEKPAFAVIGREGSTRDGADMVQRLWADANANFGMVAGIAKYTDSGALAGIWGAMTDFSRSFRPWENGFTEGLYLAGVEVPDDAEAPEGWTKWIVPAHTWLAVKVEGSDTFSAGLAAIEAAEYTLAGAVQDYTDPATGESWMWFPIA